MKATRFAARLLLALAMVASLLVTLPAATRPAEAAGIIYVTTSGSSTNDGQSWETAKDLQSAFASAGAGDEIWVAAGTYKPSAHWPSYSTDPRTATITLKDGVAIYGGFVGTESLRTGRNPNPATNGTVLSGDLSGNDTANWGNRTDNSLQVVSASGTDASAILDGFTISGGCHDNGSSPWGAGMTCEGSPTLANLVFAGNRETNLSGGGMFVGSGTPSLTNVTFIGNRSTSGNEGGMYIDGDQGRAAVSLTNAVFSGNEASSTGGAVYICSANGSVSLTNVTFCGNAGGARWVDDAITIFNSLVLPTYSVGGDAVESQQDRYL